MRNRFLMMTLAFWAMNLKADAQDLLMSKAPGLDLKSMLQVKNGQDWEKQLNGKIVVLEFWATWCTPCLANIAHLNELSHQFEDSMVQFISITDEPETKIIDFLKKRKMNGWIGIDKDGTTFKNYKITGRPRTIIVDKEGTIKYCDEPGQLSAEIIRQILAGSYQPTQYKIVEREVKLGSWGGGDDPVYTAQFKKPYLMQQSIRPSIGEGGNGSKFYNGMAGITLLKFNLSSIIAYVYNQPSALRVINKSTYADSLNWDVIYERAKKCTHERAKGELKKMVNDGFNVQITDTIISQDVLEPNFAKSIFLIKENNIDFNKPETKTFQSLDNIFNTLEEKLNIIIYHPEDTNEQYIDIYEIISKYYKMNGEEIKSWLISKGVEFHEAKRPVKELVVRDNS